MTIDLNCDMGELQDAETEEALMQYITSANIACGAHAGDEQTMGKTAMLALVSQVAVGAHPSYPDRENFGRIEMALSESDIEKTVYEQVKRLARIVSRLGGDILHVKPHGALYNVAARSSGVAHAIACGVSRWSRDVVLVGLAGSRMLEVWHAMGFRVAGEAFADRRYEPDGSLRARKFPDALITNPHAAAAQAVELAGGHRVQTICIHSDTPDSVRIAEAVAHALTGAGIKRKRLSAAPPPRVS